ncbi:AEC family transporter [Rubrobacter indicoceani]|uniref:AEC family transporter n=1 Tax=Rubrobacter indicoceani TaxID=2051957 RepID=UPI000E5B5805|nr:AEC family transporter [Rubrobacter indicoceani]
MEIIFETVVPLFGLVLCGFLAGKLGVLGPASFEGLNRYVFYFALPALTFSVLSGLSLSEVVNGRFLGAYLGAGLSAFVLAAVFGKVFFGLKREEWAMIGAGASLGNTGYMGLPLMGAALGAQATGIIALGLAAEAIIILPLAMILIESGRGVGRLSEKVASIARHLSKNPLILSLAAGAAFSLFGLSLPVPAANFVDLLGSTAGPVALFALGATLSAFRISSHPGEVTAMSAFKLLLHPALMLAFVFALGVPQPWSSVALIAASLPVAANVFVIARQYDAYVQRVSSVVLVSTAGSIVTVSVVVSLATG